MDPSFKKLQTLTLKDQFVQEIENMIVSGQLPIGSKLPTERELAEKMGVSRAVVNSGLAEMENKGFLEVHPRSGTFVADYKYTGTLDVLTSIMRYDGHSFLNSMGDSLLQFRQGIEENAAAMAAEHRTDEQLEKLTALLNAMALAESAEDMAELSFNFHHTICVASENPIYPIVFHSFKIVLCSLVTHMYRFADRKPLIDMHREILDHIRNREPDKAEQTMTRFLVYEVEQTKAYAHR
jgi:DNA-binding FadR family transcriptional regulator